MAQMGWEANLRFDVRTKIGKGWNIRLNSGLPQLVYRRTYQGDTNADSTRLKDIEWSERNYSKLLEICALLAERKKASSMSLKDAYKQLRNRIKWIAARKNSFKVSTFTASALKHDEIKSYCLMAKRWSGMLARCHDPTNPSYELYGARGISVCEEWFSFDAFLQFWQFPPFEGAQLGRIDNDGDYEPSNCEWQDQADQNRNKRNTRFLTYNGETKPLWQWAMQYNIGSRRLSERLRRGWDAKRALETPCPKGFDKERKERIEANQANWSINGHLYQARSRYRRGLELGLPIQDLLAVEGTDPISRAHQH